MLKRISQIKRLALLICLCAIVACGKNDSASPAKDTKALEISKVLTGHFIGSFESLGQTQYEELTFYPYSEPKEIVSLFGTFNAYGTVALKQYYNDHLLVTNKDCYYAIDGNASTVSFYQYDKGSMDVKNKEDKRKYTPISSSSFKLCDYGLTDNNALTYSKQQ